MPAPAQRRVIPVVGPRTIRRHFPQPQRWGVPSFAAPGYSSAQFVCSAYCGVAGATLAGLHWNKADTGTPTVETSTVPPGATAAWRFTCTGTAICKEVAPPASTKFVVIRLWFQILSLPSATSHLIRCEATGTDMSVRVSTTGAVQIKSGSSSVTLGTIAAADGWHYVDAKFDATVSGACLSTARLDGGTEQTAGPDATGSGDLTRIRIGNQTSSTWDVIVGRIVIGWSTDASASRDYPIGPNSAGSTKGFVPQSASGAHAEPGLFTLSGGGSPSNGDASGALLDEWPPNTSDYVEQTTAGTSAYVEHVFATSSETGTPLAVAHLVTVTAASAAADTQKAQLFDGIVALDSFGLLDAGTTGTRAYQDVYTMPPSGGPWTVPLFQALRQRWGFSDDVTPAPRLTAAMLEAELGPSTGGSNVNRTASDALTFSDAASRVATLARSAADALTNSDAAARVATLIRTGADALTFADVGSRVTTAVRTATDALTFSDAATRTKAAVRTATDALQFSDTGTRIATLIRTAPDALTFSDAATATKVILRSAADSLGFSDAGARLLSAARTATDALTFGDTASRVGAFVRTGADALTFSDAATRVKTVVRSAADTLTFSDAGVRILVAARSTADALTTSDTAARLGSFVRTAADALTFSDSAAGLRVTLRSAVDSLGFSDAAARTGTFLRAAGDALTFSDAATRAKAAVRTAADALTFSDAATRTKTVVRSAADALTHSDVASRAVAAVRSAVDSLGFSDLASAIGGGAITFIGGVPPRIAGAVRTLVGGLASHVRPGGSSSGPKPGGSADHPKPGA